MTSEADLLAAIYAAPDDDAPRSVYADWLLDRSDPRGEFIALSLAGATDGRAEALLEAHGAGWAGRLGGVLVKSGRRFARGFLCGGSFRGKLGASEVEAAVTWPEWGLFEALEVSRVDDAAFRSVAKAPWFGRLRTIHGVNTAQVRAITKNGSNACIEELELRAGIELPTSLAVRFPKLRRLRIEARTPADWNVIPSLPSTLERFALFRGEESFELRPDAEGRFTRLDVRNPESESAFLERLRHVYPLTEISLQTKTPWSAEQIARVERQLAERRELRAISMPWSRAGFADEPFIELRFTGVENLGQRTSAILDAVTGPPMALRFDTASTNAGAEPCPGNPRPVVKKLFTQSRGWNVELYLAKARRSRRMLFDNFDLTIGAPRVPVAPLEAWLAALVDEHEIGAFSAPFLVRTAADRLELDTTSSLWPLHATFPWICGLGPDDERSFDFAELARAAKPFPWIRTKTTRRNLFFVFGDDPERQPSLEDRAAFERVLSEGFWRQFESRHQFTPAPLVDDILTRAVAPYGYVPTTRSPMGGILYVKETRKMPFEIRLARQNQTLTFDLEGKAIHDITTRETAVAALRRLALRFE